MSRPILLALAVALHLGLPPAHAQLVVTDGPTGLARHAVRARVNDHTVTVDLSLTVTNPGATVAEAVLLVPLPRDAAVSAFSMRVGGKTLAPELLDAGRARAVYERIVRRRRDPALLEIAGTAALRARAFPIPARGQLTLTVRYSHPAVREGGALRVQIPAFERGADGPARLSLELTSAHPLGALYSPTHDVEIVRDGPRRARIGYERTGPARLPVFTLYAARAGDAVQPSLAAYRDGDRPGHLLLMLSPASGQRALPRDLVLVVDRSGSMRGQKLTQARAAVHQAIDRMGPDDRFALVDFATGVQATPLAAADDASLTSVRARVDALRARGSTNLHGALRAALDVLAASQGRVPVVLLITDGQPTIGERRPDAILADIRTHNTHGARLFTFGVGADVDTRLLDRLAAEGGGLADVVQPGEQIDARTARLLGRVGAPTLTDVRVRFEGGAVGALHPQRLPDLFAGQQIVLTGRYRTPGACRVVVSGRGPDGPRRLSFPLTLPARDTRDFEVARMWARRRLAVLIDAVRLHDTPAPERVDEIIALSKRYRVLTPLTAFLITEDAPLLTQRTRMLQTLAAVRQRARVATRQTADAGLRALEDSRRCTALAR